MESSPAARDLFQGLTFFLVEYPKRRSVERHSIIEVSTSIMQNEVNLSLAAAA